MPGYFVMRNAALVVASALAALAGTSAAAAPTTTCTETCKDAAARMTMVGGAPGLLATVDTHGTDPPPVKPVRGGPSADEAAPATGGGGGAESACSWRPLGPVAEVAAAQAAINAGQTPNVANPSSDGVLVIVPGVMDMAGTSTSWYRVTGTTAQIYQEQICNGVRTSLGWFDLVADGAGGLVVQVTAQDLVPGAYDQVVRQLPTPIPRIGPADEDEDGYAYVNTPAIFWLDEVPGQWATVSGQASAGGITVTVQADPVELVVDPGDGSAPLRCTQFRPVRRADAAPGKSFPPAGSCTHRYVDASSMAPDGATWPVTVSIVWHATWSANTGEGGDLGYVETTSPVRRLPVAEIQAVIVDSDP
jgi:hypothetical protein